MSEHVGNVRVERISITGLFGLYDHEITLSRLERVTILHGPNGVGKSVLLRLIAAFFCGRYLEFVSTQFNAFTIILSDGSTATIYGLEGGELEAQGSLKVAISGAELTSSEFDLPYAMDFEKVAHQIERESPYITKLAEGRYYEHRGSQSFTAREVVDRYGSAADYSASIQFAMDKEPATLRQMREKVEVQLVETQRLLRTPPETFSRSERKAMVATVKTYSDDLVRQISRTLSRYGTESQKLDQTLPKRLSSGTSTPARELEVLKDRLLQLDARQTSLNELGLIDKVSYLATGSEIDALDDVIQKVMALYVEDAGTKLDLLDDLARKIRLLLASVNEKFRNKTLSVSRERGLQVQDYKGRPIGLESLSSGEQHELVLWFDLLFKVGANALVLIDEPELSLHVTWQKKFLPELLEISRSGSFDALVATHSPFIIGDRLDLMIALDAEVDE